MRLVGGRKGQPSSIVRPPNHLSDGKWSNELGMEFLHTLLELQVPGGKHDLIPRFESVRAAETGVRICLLVLLAILS